MFNSHRLVLSAQLAHSLTNTQHPPVGTLRLHTLANMPTPNILQWVHSGCTYLQTCKHPTSSMCVLSLHSDTCKHLKFLWWVHSTCTLKHANTHWRKQAPHTLKRLTANAFRHCDTHTPIIHKRALWTSLPNSNILRPHGIFLAALPVGYINKPPTFFPISCYINMSPYSYLLTRTARCIHIMKYAPKFRVL